MMISKKKKKTKSMGNVKIQALQIVLSCREVPPHWEWTEGHLPYNCSPSHDAAIKSRQGGVTGARPPLRRWRAAPAGGLLLPLIGTSYARLVVQLPANGTTPTAQGFKLRLSRGITVEVEKK